MSAARWVERLELQPHPEGGHYRETYRSRARIGECCLGAAFDGARAACTAIYYLLAGSERSALHRIRSDEMWHFYAGAPLTVHVLERGSGYRRIRLGGAPDGDQTPQAVVPAGCWFGATGDGAFSLVGCTVAPGFDFRDFELADRAELLREFPEQREIIERLTRC